MRRTINIQLQAIPELNQAPKSTWRTITTLLVCFELGTDSNSWTDEEKKTNVRETFCNADRRQQWNLSIHIFPESHNPQNPSTHTCCALEHIKKREVMYGQYLEVAKERSLHNFRKNVMQKFLIQSIYCCIVTATILHRPLELIQTL